MSGCLAGTGRVATNFWEHKKDAMKSLGFEPKAQCIAGNAVTIVGLAGLAVIGALVMTNILSGPLAAWIAVGIGGCMFIANLIQGQLLNRKTDAITQALISLGVVAVGLVGALGLLPFGTVALVLVVAAGAFVCCRGYANSSANAKVLYSVGTEENASSFEEIAGRTPRRLW